MPIPRILIMTAIICIAATGCSSDENSNQNTRKESEALQGYKDTLDKAQSVEQTLLQAEKARREALEQQQ